MGVRVDTREDKIEIAVILDTQPNEAWRLLTENSHIHAWWGGHVSLDARLGGRLREFWSDGGREVVTAGVVKHFEPPRLLVVSWADDDWPGETEVSFTLTGKNGGAELVLVHSGWNVLPPEKRQMLIEAHTASWAGHLERLVKHAGER